MRDLFFVKFQNDIKIIIAKEISLTPSIQIPKKLENINNSSPLDIYEYSNNQIDPSKSIV